MSRLVQWGQGLLAPSADRWRARFEPFLARGLIPAAPDSRQVFLGTRDMLSFAFNETPVEHAANRKSVWGTLPLRVPLQLLYCPQQAVVWNGLSATPRTLVKHLLSSFHEDGVISYDLQLLQSHEGGLEALERAAEDVASRRHAFGWMLRAIAGGYHEHLAELARAARRFEYPEDLDPRFSSLLGFARYCLELPR
jgi:hypothetical protein